MKKLSAITSLMIFLLLTPSWSLAPQSKLKQVVTAHNLSTVKTRTYTHELSKKQYTITETWGNECLRCGLSSLFGTPIKANGEWKIGLTQDKIHKIHDEIERLLNVMSTQIPQNQNDDFSLALSLAIPAQHTSSIPSEHINHYIDHRLRNKNFGYTQFELRLLATLIQSPITVIADGTDSGMQGTYTPFMTYAGSTEVLQKHPLFTENNISIYYSNGHYEIITPKKPEQAQIPVQLSLSNTNSPQYNTVLTEDLFNALIQNFTIVFPGSFIPDSFSEININRLGARSEVKLIPKGHQTNSTLVYA